MNYILMTNGHPPAIIFNEDKKEYYSALEIFDAAEEIEPFVSFVKNQIEKTWNPLTIRHCKKPE